MRRTEAVYVVQQRVTVYFDGEDGPQEQPGSAWADIATISVPPKTKRRTVVEKAADDLDLFEGTVELRVIPAKHAEPIKVEMEQPPPRLRIG